MLLSKKQELWSIKDYYDAYQTNTPSIQDIWEKISHKLQENKYNTFISTSKNLSKEKYSFSQLYDKIPLAIKDNICSTDFPTTCASKMLLEWYPT